MAIPWLIVLQNIPWREVIMNAPKVADEAKKLWTTLSRQTPTLDTNPAHKKPIEKPVFSSQEQAFDILQAKMIDLETTVTELHAQMLESSKLIKALADQNTQLVEHIEKNRARLRGVTFALVLICLIAVLAFIKMQMAG